MNRQDAMRRAFRAPTHVAVKVTPEGFEIVDERVAELCGRVRQVTLVRKLFEDNFLACSSPDGVRGTDGKLCDECRHPMCQPRLRLRLATDTVLYLLELNATSARNYFRLEDQATAAKTHIARWPLRLSVVSHGYWGEVCFERLNEPTP